MSLDANIFDIARLERALIAIEKKVSKVIEMLKDCDDEEEEYL